MPMLVIVSLMWAFSFGLIRHYLFSLDSAAVALLRLCLSCLAFLPWLRFRGVGAKMAASLAAIGAVQFGLMYLLYLEAFQSLAAHQVAVLTLLTPIFVSLFDAGFAQRLLLRPVFAAAMAVGGAMIIMASHPLGHAEWRGILLVQASNACFALGQLLFKRLHAQQSRANTTHWFAWMYLGAVLVALPYAAGRLAATIVIVSSTQALVIGYLGIVASGLGFFLWNRGATQVNTATLAVMNNAKIPLGVAASLVVFGETTNYVRLTVGAVLIGIALVVAEERSRGAPSI
ncbi:MAG: EamA family transporter [Polyangiaceae bacterium]